MACTVTILGNNSALPANNRHPSAQVFAINRQQLFLIDCGEGTQMQLQRYKIKPSKIHAIFISHLHGDHYYGLLPLLDSFYLMGRKKPLHLYGPPQLQEVIALQCKITGFPIPSTSWYGVCSGVNFTFK